MVTYRWWHAVVAGAVLVVGVLVALTGGVVLGSSAGSGSGDASGFGAGARWTTWAALGLLAAFALFYATVGRRGLEEERWALPLAGAIVLTTAVGTALSPDMATLQCIAYPLVWTLLASPRMGRPIVGCVVLAVGTGLGFVVSLGGGIDAVAQAVGIQGVSLALGVGIGVWFTIEVRKGDENTRLLLELQAAQEQLAALHRDAGAGEERERLARDLHDTIAQNLTSLVMLAQRAQRTTASDAGVGDAVRADLLLMEEVAREALTETRALVAASAPVPVDGGLVKALERLVATFERETRIRIVTRFDDVGPIPRDREVVLLRCAQEALANVRKHSTAQHARLTLEHADGDGRLTLTVSDDGRGIAGAVGDGDGDGDADARATLAGSLPGDPPQSGFGLEGMRQRLALVGGTLKVAGAPGGGTELVATIDGGTT
ncbi:sensor histidine kinase [Herbiconiux liukaitaii]|uniref:sensor histidine kinase n=1 Tax=Herbiconiux liukaitaii TaxID=3342799 RepID=UPI0035BA34CF